MPVIPRTRLVFRRRVRAQIRYGQKLLASLLDYDTNHPTLDLFTGPDRAACNTVIVALGNALTKKA